MPVNIALVIRSYTHAINQFHCAVRREKIAYLFLASLATGAAAFIDIFNLSDL